MRILPSLPFLWLADALATEIRRIRDTIAPYAFERLYGGWFDTVVASNAHHAVQASANRYIQALEHRLS